MLGADGQPLSEKLDPEAIAEIRRLEAEFDKMETQAIKLNEKGWQTRADAAELIVLQLERGATERDVAAAIGKSNSHVHFAATAWRYLQTSENITDFNQAYKLVQRPDRPAITAGAGSAQDSGEVAYPKWSKQMKALRDLTGEMYEQADYNQVVAYVKALAKALKLAAAKEQELESAPGQTRSQTAA